MKKFFVLASLLCLIASVASAQSPQRQRTLRADPKLFPPDKKPLASRAPSASAATPKVGADESAEVDRILQKYMDAQGGARAMASFRTRIMRGTVTHSQSNHPGTLEYYAKAPDKTLTVVEVPGAGQFIEAFDGSRDWMSNPITGSVAIEQATVVVLDRGSEFGRMPKAAKM